MYHVTTSLHWQGVERRYLSNGQNGWYSVIRQKLGSGNMWLTSKMNLMILGLLLRGEDFPLHGRS